MEKNTKEKKLVMPLPPSINTAFTRNRYTGFLAHTNEYTSYLNVGSMMVKVYCKRNGIKPIEEYTPLYLEFYLKNPRSDSHNLLKVLLDCLERGEMFKNDRWILNQTLKVVIDKENPRVELWLGESVGNT